MTFGQLRFQLSKLLPSADPDVLDGAINDRLQSIHLHLNWKAAELYPLVLPYGSSDTSRAIPEWVSIAAIRAGVLADLDGNVFRSAQWEYELAQMRRADARMRGPSPLKIAETFRRKRRSEFGYSSPASCCAGSAAAAAAGAARIGGATATTADGGSTFTAICAGAPLGLVVFVNGLKQTEDTDYTLTVAGAQVVILPISGFGPSPLVTISYLWGGGASRLGDAAAALADEDYTAICAGAPRGLAVFVNGLKQAENVDYTVVISGLSVAITPLADWGASPLVTASYVWGGSSRWGEATASLGDGVYTAACAAAPLGVVVFVNGLKQTENIDYTVAISGLSVAITPLADWGASPLVTAGYLYYTS